MTEKTSFYYVDDLDGARLDIDDHRHVTWSWAGVNYEFDTSATNREEIERGHVTVATLLAASVRKVGGGRSARRIVPEVAGHTVSTLGQVRIGEVRAWALANRHYGVGKRGRLSSTVIAAYKQAHSDTQGGYA
jgi:hypothetical protein